MNKNDAPVKVLNFQTSCSCLSVFRKVGNAKQAINSLEIGEGSAVTIHAEVRVSGVAGSPQHTRIVFHDSGRPDVPNEVDIAFTPVAHVYPVPQSVILGNIEEEIAKAIRIELRSDGSFDGKIGPVLSSDDSICSVEFRAPTTDERAEVFDSSGGQELVGFIEASFTPPSNGDVLSESITVKSDEEVLCIVPVHGRVARRYTLNPQALLLPRKSAGRSSYATQVICSSRDGSAFQLEPQVDGVPFTVQVDRSPSPGIVRLALEYHGNREITEPRTFEVAFKCDDGDGPYLLRLPVTVLPEN